VLVGIRWHDVVGVEEGDELAFGDFDSEVPCDALPGVLLTECPDPTVAGGVLLDDLRRSIGGAVIDDDDLKPVQSLPEHTVQALGKVFFDVVDGNDDAQVGDAERGESREPRGYPPTKPVR